MKTENIFGEPAAEPDGRLNNLRGWRINDIAEVRDSGRVGYVNGVSKDTLWLRFNSFIDGEPTPFATPYHPSDLVNKSRGD